MNVKENKISIIIPHLKGKAMLISCLKRVYKQTYLNFEVILVDNGSNDGSAEYVKIHFPQVIIVKHKNNLGFAGGVNSGIKAANGNLIALLNDDAQPEARWLEYLVEGFVDKNVFAVAPKIYQGSFNNSANIIESVGDYYSCWGFASAIDNGQKDGNIKTYKTVFSATGGASIYRKDIIEKLGYFDEDFFAYFEDVDICFRARLLGYYVVTAPKSLVYHLGSVTSGGDTSPFKKYLVSRNIWYVYLKNMPGLLFWRYLPYYVYMTFSALNVSRRQHLLPTHIRAILSSMLMSPKMLMKRIGIQKSKEVKNEQLNELFDKDIVFPYAIKLRKVLGRLKK
jgi:GT2 family glycosyltransferase